MIEALGGVTSQLIEVALDAALLRHELIAHNISNYDTPGYQAKRLGFEEHLSDAARALVGGDGSTSSGRIESLNTYLREGSPVVVTADEPVELDREMIKLAENTLRYQAILRAAGKRGELLSMAVNGGRR